MLCDNIMLLLLLLLLLLFSNHFHYWVFPFLAAPIYLDKIHILLISKWLLLSSRSSYDRSLQSSSFVSPPRAYWKSARVIHAIMLYAFWVKHCYHRPSLVPRRKHMGFAVPRWPYWSTCSSGRSYSNLCPSAMCECASQTIFVGLPTTGTIVQLITTSTTMTYATTTAFANPCGYSDVAAAGPQITPSLCGTPSSIQSIASTTPSSIPSIPSSTQAIASTTPSRIPISCAIK